MNSGPMGSTTAVSTMRSIIWRSASSSDQPATPSAACTWSGCRPPQSATLIPWSSIQRTARWMTRLSKRVLASSSSCRTASRY